MGYYLARPEYPKPNTKINLTPFNVVNTSKTNKIKQITCLLPIGNLVEQATSVHKNTKIELVHNIMEKDPSIASIVVCDNNKRPIGLIMAYHLTKKLASQFGVALYYKRPVSVIMDKDFICVDESTSVEITAQKATSRERYKAYDDIIVTRENKLLGVVSVQKLIDYMTQVQIEMARGSNPLTGLPGNRSIEQEIERRLASGLPCSIIYADLDNFKIYNDTYGFKKGVDCQNKSGKCNLQQICERAAEVKKMAKAIQGNSYFRDRRAPL
jgi:CBS domain-containing protein